MHWKKPFYGWIVCVMGALLLFITMGIMSNIFPVFLPYVETQNGLTGTQGSFLVTLRCLVSFCSMLFIGQYYKKFSLRVGMSIAALLGGASFCLYSVSHTYVMLCAASTLCGLSYGLGTMIPVSILMNNWFHTRKALSLGICATGSGIASFVLPPLTTKIIEELSLSQAFLIEGVGIFVITAVFFLLVRDKPADKDLEPYGRSQSPAQEEQICEAAAGTGQAMNRTVRVLLIFASLFMGAVAGSGSAHMPLLFSLEGYNAMTVSYFLSAVGIIGVVAKLLYGQVTDQLGGRRSSLLFTAVLMAGHMFCCLAFTNNSVILVVTAVLLGVGYPIVTIGPAVWAGDMDSPDHFARTVRVLQLSYAGGSLLFSEIPGMLYDVFGTYIPAYILFSCLMALELVFLAISYQKKTAGITK